MMPTASKARLAAFNLINCNICDLDDWVRAGGADDATGNDAPTASP